MKKDIHIPEVTDIEMAIVLEHNDTHNTEDWNVYLINKKSTNIEMVVIVSQGFSETKTTSVFRKKLDALPANSIAKIELIQPELFALDNRFQVSFFEGNTLYDKTFLFEKNTIKEGSLRMIKGINKRGVICK
ncbi:conserved protein of unknown function [Tenacibaculum sp. 190524A02b]|uniref:Phenylalanyl-tRNA synthetase subunit alpha n=1 Tax=Tenacibaculum vairaonense TaxID=3137860 RepID=A0ABP1FC30_9FLAO